MQLEAEKYGYELIALSGNQDPARQNNQLSDFVAQGYDAIFLNPVDSKSAGEGVKKAYYAGIPVFTFDIQVTDNDAKKLIKKKQKLTSKKEIFDLIDIVISTLINQNLISDKYYSDTKYSISYSKKQ